MEAAMARSDRMRSLFLAMTWLAGSAACRAACAEDWPEPVGQVLAFAANDPAIPRSALEPALLNLPAGWLSGDAAVVLAPGGAWPEGLRDRLVAVLLESGAAVLEVTSPRRGPGRSEAVAAQDMLAALRMLREVQGAGLIIAIGFGEGGEAALAAARSAPHGGEGFAASVRLGPGVPGFVAGEPAAIEAWPLRAPLFCDLLAGAQPEAPGFARLCLDRLAAIH